MRLHRPGAQLVAESRPLPTPQPGQLLLRVRACGVCRTDLHVVDGDLPFLGAPLVPGMKSSAKSSHKATTSVCHSARDSACRGSATPAGNANSVFAARRNLCDRARFTGYSLDGGYAEHVVADARYCFELPQAMDDAHVAPLLCAGLIGYRSWRFARDAQRLGIYGFGAAAHIVAQVARWHGQEIYAFTRPGDIHAQQFATELGACWAGDSDREPPVQLDAAIIFASVGALVPLALRALRKGGTLVCGGIHMSDVPAMPYSLLWGERSIRSVANLTRRDGVEFLALAARIPVKTQVETFALTDANAALESLRTGALTGAAVLLP